MDSNPEEDIFDTLDFVLYIGKKEEENACLPTFLSAEWTNYFRGVHRCHCLYWCLCLLIQLWKNMGAYRPDFTRLLFKNHQKQYSCSCIFQQNVNNSLVSVKTFQMNINFMQQNVTFLWLTCLWWLRFLFLFNSTYWSDWETTAAPQKIQKCFGLCFGSAQI